MLLMPSMVLFDQLYRVIDKSIFKFKTKNWKNCQTWQKQDISYFDEP